MENTLTKLPDGVAESWFHVHAGGEVWTSRVCRGTDLLKVLDELMGMDAGYAECLADADSWYVLDGKCRSISFACGEDPDIEITMIEAPEFDLRFACEVFERYARGIGKDVQILLTNDGAEVAPLTAPGSSTGKTLFEAMEDAIS